MLSYSVIRNVASIEFNFTRQSFELAKVLVESSAGSNEHNPVNHPVQTLTLRSVEQLSGSTRTAPLMCIKIVALSTMSGCQASIPS